MKKWGALEEGFLPFLQNDDSHKSSFVILWSEGLKQALVFTAIHWWLECGLEQDINNCLLLFTEVLSVGLKRALKCFLPWVEKSFCPGSRSFRKVLKNCSKYDQIYTFYMEKYTFGTNASPNFLSLPCSNCTWNKQVPVYLATWVNIFPSICLTNHPLERKWQWLINYLDSLHDGVARQGSRWNHFGQPFANQTVVVQSAHKHKIQQKTIDIYTCIKALFQRSNGFPW